ncbi:MAG: hypothetical protein Q9O74_05145 [Planctomycetota bacterium]|nr:hypothetical protein [Planctomycetota bacterium]
MSIVGDVRDYGPKELLYFLHIPKTAGSALRTFLEDKFSIDNICPYLEFSALLPQPPSVLGGYRLICGHHGLYLRQMIGAPMRMVTVLREPLGRAVSHYRHLKATKDNWLNEWIQDKSFEEFVLSDQGVAELLNFQTRFLALDNIQNDYFGHSRLNQKGRAGLERKYGDPAMLRRAIETLDAIDVVGVQDRFSDTLRLVCAEFGWPEVRSFPEYNKGVARFSDSEITDRARSRVVELSGFDEQLYCMASDRVENEIDRLTPEVARDRYTAAMRARPRQSLVRLGFDSPILGDNWFVREKIADGSWARWSGPGRVTTLDLPLPCEKPLMLRFFAGAHTMDVIESVRVFANDDELDLSWWQMHDPPQAQRTFEAVLTPETLSKNDAYCRLRFEVSRTVVPAEEWPGRDDKRSFAMYFFWLEVFAE